MLNFWVCRRIKLHQTIKVLAGLFLILMVYILFQYRYAIINPPVTLDSPQDNVVIQSRRVVVSGKTDPNATVYVNEDTVALEEDGTFRKVITVFSGKNTITVKAVNRFGRETVIKREVDINASD